MHTRSKVRLKESFDDEKVVILRLYFSIKKIHDTTQSTTYHFGSKGQKISHLNLCVTVRTVRYF